MTLDQPSAVPQHPEQVFRIGHQDVSAAPPAAAPVAGVEDGLQAGCCSTAHAAVCCDPTEKAILLRHHLRRPGTAVAGDAGKGIGSDGHHHGLAGPA